MVSRPAARRGACHRPSSRGRRCRFAVKTRRPAMRRLAKPAATPHERHGTLPVPVAAVVRAVPRADATVAPMTFILPDLPWAVCCVRSCAMRAPAILSSSTPTRCAACRAHRAAAGRDDLRRPPGRAAAARVRTSPAAQDALHRTVPIGTAATPRWTTPPKQTGSVAVSPGGARCRSVVALRSAGRREAACARHPVHWNRWRVVRRDQRRIVRLFRCRMLRLELTLTRCTTYNRIHVVRSAPE